MFEVARVESLHPVPGAAPAIKGMTHVRGQIYAVIDLARLYESTGGTDNENAKLMVIGRASAEAAILVDEVYQVGGAESGGEDVIPLDVGALLGDTQLFADGDVR